jgi:iron complex outermembrane receptor protein
MRRCHSSPWVVLPARHNASWMAVVGSLAGISGAAHAQLEEIIVTAERREMSLQDTPISVIAFTGDTLEFKGVRDMFELADAAPNLDIKGSRGSGNTSPNYQIRGIGGGGGATGERGVGFYIDNVFMPRSTGPVMRVLDVERVEVLRGPQGTLFGRNSTGGAIRVFSKQPSAERDGYLKLTGGNFDHRDISAMINVPVTDQLFFRAQAARLEQDGFVRRGPQMLGDSEDTIVRLQGAFEPSDTLRVTVGLLRTDSDSNGSPTDLVQFNMAPACPFDPTNPYICWEGNYADWMSDFLEQYGQPRLTHDDPRLVLDDFTMPDFCFLDGPDPDWDDACLQWNKAKYSQADINIVWDIGDRVRMTSTTGLSEFSSDGVSDWQLLGMEYRREQVESDVFYQEFQFNLELFDGKVELVTGLNYFHEDSESPRGALYNAVGSSTYNAQTGGSANGNLWGCVVGGATGPFCSSPERRLRVTGDSYTAQKSEAYGIFANATWHLHERVNLTLGLRESYDKKDFSNTLYASDNFIPQDGVSTTVQDSDDWRKTDWRATVDLRITDDVMVYLTGAQAFRSGTFSVPAALAPTSTRPYHLRPPPAAVPPEELVNREVGLRSEWLGGRLRFNATYFDMDFTNRQGASAVVDPNAPTGFVIQLVNQGDVTLDGMEIEAMLAVTDRLTLDATAGWVDYGFFLFPPPMDRAVTFGARYELPMASGANMSFGLSLARNGPQETHSGGLTPEQVAALGCPSSLPTAFVDSRYRLEGYEILNGIIRYTSPDGRWSAGLYGNNLTDETYANNAQSFGRGYWGAGGPPSGINIVPRSAVAEYRARPREFGITFQYNFFE